MRLQELFEANVDKATFIDQIMPMLGTLAYERGPKAVDAVLHRYLGFPEATTLHPYEINNLMLRLSPEDLSALMYRLKGMIEKQGSILDKRAYQQMLRHAH